MYPLGPLVFAASFPLLGYAAAVLVSRRALRLEMPHVVRRMLLVGVLVTVALNWAAKLIWLGV